MGDFSFDINIEEAREVATQMGTVVAKLNSAKSKLDAAEIEPSVWEGAAYSEFNTKYATVKQDIDTLIAAVEDVKARLYKITGIYEEADGTVSKSGQNLIVETKPQCASVFGGAVM